MMQFGNKENTAQRGLVGQTIILARLVELGKEVLLPWGDHRRYDIAYCEQGDAFRVARLVRIQCKLGWFYDEGAGIEFSTMSILVKPGKGHIRRGYRGDIE
jgi:PD-(D/E)XK endonuclease